MEPVTLNVEREFYLTIISSMAEKSNKRVKMGTRKRRKEKLTMFGAWDDW